jgi:hypothetical protein
MPGGLAALVLTISKAPSKLPGPGYVLPEVTSNLVCPRKVVIYIKDESSLM